MRCKECQQAIDASPMIPGGIINLPHLDCVRDEPVKPQTDPTQIARGYFLSQPDEAVAIESKKMQEISELRIQQAVREAVLRTIESRKDVWIQEGYTAAREQAAGIADAIEEFIALPDTGIAERIRAMTPGGK